MNGDCACSPLDLPAMRAEVITIGDELLIGQVIDTNSAFMAEHLNEQGIELYQITSVHDDANHIRRAVEEALDRVDLVITTGGLGPTKDDITKRVLCEFFSTDLVASAEVEAHVRELYKDRSDVLNRLTETQWMVPRSATILPNRVGSAPLMCWHLASGKMLFSLPGVPYEMEIAMREQVLPYIQSAISASNGEKENITHCTIMVSGIPESSLALLLESWEDALPTDIHLAYLPKDGTIRLRLSGYGINPERVYAEKEKLKVLVRDYMVLDEDIPMELAVGKSLQQSGCTISTAESCTGGKLASLLNRHPGASAWYWGSVVAYDNSVKTNVLGVKEQTLREHGAVSEQCVREMAEGVRRLCHTDYAIATSGIAGPSGGTPDKPVGTVWIAWATPTQTVAECFHLGRLRDQITDRACQRALIRMYKLISQ